MPKALLTTWMNNQLIIHGCIICFSRFIIQLEMWVLSGLKSAEVHEAMTELSGSKHTSEQHVEQGTSRKSEEILLILWRLFSGYKLSTRSC